MAYKIMNRILNGEDTQDRVDFLHEITYISPENFISMDGDGFSRPHSQNYYELIFFHRGCREISVNKKSRLYMAGDIFAVAPGEMHAGKMCDSVLDRYYIHIGKNVPEKYPFFKELIYTIFEDEIYDERNFIRPCESDFDKIEELLNKADNAVHFGNDKTRNAEIFSYILQILVILGNNLRSKKDSVKKPELLFEILAYIENSYEEIKSLEQICHIFAISKSTLWRMFSKWLQKSPSQFITEKRLEGALQYLKEGQSVSEASENCGFCDESHFISIFKKYYGITPFRYQKAQMCSQ